MRKKNRKNRKILARSAARLAAMQAIYQYEMEEISIARLLDEFHEHWLQAKTHSAAQNTAQNTAQGTTTQSADSPSSERSSSLGSDFTSPASLGPGSREPNAAAEVDIVFFDDVVCGTLERVTEIDALIAERLAVGWSLARLDKAAKAILRAGAFELLARRDVPTGAVIDEYVEIAKAFFAAQEVGFVNGVLDRIARSVRPGSGDEPARVAADSAPESAADSAPENAADNSDVFNEQP